MVLLCHEIEGSQSSHTPLLAVFRFLWRYDYVMLSFSDWAAQYRHSCISPWCGRVSLWRLSETVAHQWLYSEVHGVLHGVLASFQDHLNFIPRLRVSFPGLPSSISRPPNLILTAYFSPVSRPCQPHFQPTLISSASFPNICTVLVSPPTILALFLKHQHSLTSFLNQSASF